ncbi:hypothetical protein M0R19_04625 [Candidatus Pacearchaeota archaeon]|jgi:divalent metal cation (Fe/Co/Zn/Cd) transporter|nr:hypothetical protein [Candidatus Pacearchaeota archaeon]
MEWIKYLAEASGAVIIAVVAFYILWQQNKTWITFFQSEKIKADDVISKVTAALTAQSVSVNELLLLVRENTKSDKVLTDSLKICSDNIKDCQSMLSKIEGMAIVLSGKKEGK